MLQIFHVCNRFISILLDFIALIFHFLPYCILSILEQCGIERLTSKQLFRRLNKEVQLGIYATGNCFPK